MVKLRSDSVDRLFQTILHLKTIDECYDFFEDLCTITELKSIAQRWAVAKQLDSGETYQQIAQQLSASSATIGRVNRCLYYGAGGYRLMLDRQRGKER